MRNIKFTERIEIDCSPEYAFDYTQDYKNRLSWDTFLIKAMLTDGATTADTGVKAYCVAKNGLGMETEYVSFNRPERTAIKMTKGPFMFKTFFGTWTFKEIKDRKTEVSFIYAYQLRFPFSIVGALIKRNLQRNVKQRLRDLKKNIEQAASMT